MFTEDQAKKVAKGINGTHAFPEQVDKLTQEVVREARGKRTAKVGKHKTNGVVRHVVHVTTEDHTEAPHTVSSALHQAFPLA
jgi:hypothetical protein